MATDALATSSTVDMVAWFFGGVLLSTRMIPFALFVDRLSSLPNQTLRYVAGMWIEWASVAGRGLDLLGVEYHPFVAAIDAVKSSLLENR